MCCVGLQSATHNHNMVAVGSLFLLCLTASSDHCRHGTADDLRRHAATPLFCVKASSSSRSSGLRREDRTQSFLSAQSAGIEGEIDGGVNILKLDVHQLRWEEKFLLLKRFKEREGHCNVPRSHKDDGANLGEWVSHQRRLKKTGKLDPYRQKILNEFGFEWVLVERRASVSWEDIVSLLKQFKTREGHCNVPLSHKEDGSNLGAWVSTQRHLKKKEKLDPDRQKILEAIGFEWVLVERRANAPWEDIFSLLKQFKKREGHCDVLHSHKEDGVKLGHWVNNQRQLKRKEKLDLKSQKRLEDIGFEWWLASAKWDERYAILKKFKEREGHCHVLLLHKEDGVKLGHWVNNQRKLKRKEKLDLESQKRLEDIGFEWLLASAKWDEMCVNLKQFKKREGHCNVSKSHKEDGAILGSWVSQQRRVKKTGKLDPDRQEILEEIGFEWTA
jgi:hypothetical protein